MNGKNTGSAIRVPKNQPLPIKQMQQFVNNKKIEGKSSFTFKKFGKKKKNLPYHQTRYVVQGISEQSVKSNSALVKIYIQIFAIIRGPMCS